MRIRTIKPEFFDSPHTAEASAVLRLAYIGLWCWADDTGHGTCNPKELEGAIFPNDDLAVLSHGEFADFRGILPQLAAVFGVLFYEVDGRVFFEIPSWNRHQRTREGASSRFPMPDEGKPLFTCENTGQSDNLPQSAATRGEIPPGTGEQGNRGTGEQGNTCATAHADCATAPANTYPAAFETFWDIYPLKRGKRKALNAWTKARRRASDEAINEGAARYRDDPNRDPGYTKYAEGWLNGDGWDDAPIPQRRQTLTARQSAELDDYAAAQAFDAQHTTDYLQIEGGYQ